MSKSPQSKEPGAAIVLVVLAVVILFLMGVGLLSLGLRSRVLAIRTASGIKARCAADAGLTKAVFEMNEKLKAKPWDGSTLPEVIDEQLFDATFSYAVTGNIGSGYIIESIGRSGQAEKRVYAEIELQGLFEISILTQGDLVLKSNTLIGGYNSLDPNDTDVEVKIATSSILADGIVLNSGVVVDGDVLVGVGGDVDMVIKDLGGTTGARYPMLEEPVLSEVTPPELADKGNIDLMKEIKTISPADSGEYTEIILKNDAILEIDGGDVVLYVTGDIDLGQNCEIKIEEGASLTLYLDGDFEAGNSAGINNKNSPTKFELYGTGQAGQCLDLKAKSESFGAVYAPDAVIIVRADGDVYGSLVAEEFEFKAGSDFYYDEALRNVSVDDEGVRFVIKGWREE